MKIVIAALSAPMQMNGVSRHAANMIPALLTNNSVSEVHFITGSWQKQIFRRSLEYNDPRFHIHFVELRDARIGGLAWYIRDLPQIATQLEADIVHFACPAPVRAGAFRCSTVVSLHDLYPFDIPENFGFCKSSITRWIMARCLRNIDAIACVSESTRKRLEKRFPEHVARSVTICNVVERDRSPHIETFGLLPDTRTFLLCVAQHRSNKNIALAIRILDSLIHQRIVPCSSQLVVVGISGPETQRIRELVRNLRLERNVLLLSGITDTELQWCYRHCKLLVAPSTTEGFGLPIAEAMLAGCPVVCSDIPAFREIGGDACHYVEMGEGAMRRYVDTIHHVLTLRRPAPIPLPQLSARSVGRHYAALYEKLTSCSIPDFCHAAASRT